MAIKSATATSAAWTPFFGQLFCSRAGFFASPVKRLDDALNAVAPPGGDINPHHHERLVCWIVEFSDFVEDGSHRFLSEVCTHKVDGVLSQLRAVATVVGICALLGPLWVFLTRG